MKRRLLLLLVLAASTGGCNAVVRGGKLSSVPVEGKTMFLSTGDSPRPYRTIGFIQVRGYGVEVAGFADVGDAQLDGTLKGTMATEASEMGGNGVINIEFNDENPSTDIERMQAAAKTVQSMSTKKPKVETKDRYVTATGEVIQFLQ